MFLIYSTIITVSICTMLFLGITFYDRWYGKLMCFMGGFVVQILTSYFLTHKFNL